jgi:hypothetical protein
VDSFLVVLVIGLLLFLSTLSPHRRFLSKGKRLRR